MSSNTIRRFYTKESAENANGVRNGAWAVEEKFLNAVDNSYSIMWVSVMMNGSRAMYLRMNGNYE